MANVLTGIPLVEVTAPDGSKSLWVAAVSHEAALGAVKQVIPPDYVAALLRQRLTIYPEGRNTSARRSAEAQAMTRLPQNCVAPTLTMREVLVAKSGRLMSV
jgi:hypothetical protein